MRNLASCICALLIVFFALAPGASAQEEGQDDASEYVRPGFYVGGGGGVGFPIVWDNDFDDDLTKLASTLSFQNGNSNIVAIDGADRALMQLITVDGTDIDDDYRFGVNGVVGYRAGPRAAFELEGEWLIGSNKSNLDINNSTGTHTVEVDKIWTITANVKAYLPFITGRFQPFGKFGVGLRHSRLITDIATFGLTTTNVDADLVVPADFIIKTTESSLDGALRWGAGIDIYATPNFLTEINATYVVPFADVGSLHSDYVSIQWRLIYRF